MRNRNASDKLKPLTTAGTLLSIKNYLETLNIPCAQLHVRNPIYEEIKLRFNVKFLDGLDSNFFTSQLNEDIKKHLAPWAFEEGVDVAFGGKIHKSMLVNFVEQREYVDFVSCFDMIQIIPSTPTPEERIVNEAVANTSSSILTSAPLHEISAISSENCDNCGSNLIISTAANGVTSSTCSCEETPNSKCDADGIGVMIVDGIIKPFRVED